MTCGPLRQLHDDLQLAYGPQRWWPQTHGETEICIGAILVQHGTWVAAARAIANLKGAQLLDLARLADAPSEALEALVQPAGMPSVKAGRLQAFARAVVREHGTLEALLSGDAQSIRERCLAIHGIGPETADAIALYAARRPTAVVDAYTRRLLDRLELGPRDPGNGAHADDRRRRWVLDQAARVGLASAEWLGEWHALVVEHGKQRCRARRPRCDGCPLLARCAYGCGVERPEAGTPTRVARAIRPAETG